MYSQASSTLPHTPTSPPPTGPGCQMPANVLEKNSRPSLVVPYSAPISSSLFRSTSPHTRKRSNTGKEAVIAMARQEVPTVDQVTHASGSHKANGHANGSLKDATNASGRQTNGGPVTRSRKA